MSKVWNLSYGVCYEVFYTSLCASVVERRRAHTLPAALSMNTIRAAHTYRVGSARWLQRDTCSNPQCEYQETTFADHSHCIRGTRTAPICVWLDAHAYGAHLPGCGLWGVSSALLLGSESCELGGPAQSVHQGKHRRVALATNKEVALGAAEIKAPCIPSVGSG